jgi:LysM repeat protein
MTTTGRIIVVTVAAVSLVTLTVIAMNYLRPPEAKPPIPVPPDVQTPAGPTPVAAVGAGAPVGGPGTPVAAAADPKAPPIVGAAGVAGTPTGGAAPAAAGPGEAIADDGLAMAASGRIVEAQLRLSAAIRAGVDGPKGKAVREALMNLAERAQLSGARLPEDTYSKAYQVARGDSVTRIGQKFLIPKELVMRLNGMTSSDIAAGQSIKVVQGPVNVEISKSRHELQAWLGDICIRVYPVAIGKTNSTPEGTFIVKNKMVSPPYQPQHKPKSEHRDSGAADNPLGTRWIDIGNHYGIHGTIDPASIGSDVSEGCIRMHNKEVEELYDLMVQGGSKVIVKP